MNCDQFDFSSTLSHQRIRKGKAILGDRIVNRVLAWALFLLGASKPMVCSGLNFKPGSLRTLLYRIQSQGMGARKIEGAKHHPLKQMARPERQNR